MIRLVEMRCKNNIKSDVNQVLLLFLIFYSPLFVNELQEYYCAKTHNLPLFIAVAPLSCIPGYDRCWQNSGQWLSPG
jgi:hypothetical protein